MLQDDAGDPAEEEKNQDGPLIMPPENLPPSPSSEGCLESRNRWSSRLMIHILSELTVQEFSNTRAVDEKV